MITADRLAQAFGLTTAGAVLEPLRHGDFPTWKLITADGRYVVKELAPAAADFPRAYVERAMGLEQYASDAGIRTATPLVPVRPEAGWCTKITGHGWYRAHRWVAHQPVRAGEQITGWLGQTMATLHRLMPNQPAPGLTIRGVRPNEIWREWIAEAERHGRSWAGPGRARLPFIEELSDRLRNLYARVPDWVITHADLEAHNILITRDGPVLIDWDTVWRFSAALQAGHAAFRIGEGRTDRIRAILDAYIDAGGRADWPGADLFLSAAAQKLAALGILITEQLGSRPVPRWAGTEDPDRQIADRFDRLPGLVDELDEQARRLAE